jgi:polyketide biosynthesis enoyl-CoA hydratase PksI
MTADFRTVRLDTDGPVALVRMTDGDNAMRPRLRVGLEQALAAAVADPNVRVVVALGLDTVFCSGAPRDVLVDGGQGLPLSEYGPFARAFALCPLPVVAAMRAHAIGGGLAMGLYADVPVLSERSVYAANFLQYGVAPYIGVTHIVPRRLGSALGTEMILTARAYRGAELRARGAGVTVVAHTVVEEHAAAVAHRIAQAPRRSLELVKQQLAAAVLADTDLAMEREIEPHLQSRALAEVRERGETGYGPPSPSTRHRAEVGS